MQQPVGDFELDRGAAAYAIDPTAGSARGLLLIRIADILFSSAMLLLFLPLMLLIAIAVYVTDPGPIIFGHRRVGRHGRSFKCLKFRSMVVGAEARLQQLLASDPALQAAWDRDHKLPADPRITRIGGFLRASSLDELPQLINVLRGEMSLVGPRPISEAEVPRYGRYIADYYQTTPGVTGLWQISGRNDVSYRRRVALDVAFSRSLNLKLYMRILVMTVPAVILARGSY
jgi:lipopolysaccharide/colanic/teichoic acid biosynthesis glycosyltransferase